MNEAEIALAYMAAVTILPMAPAFVLFKFLPSTGDATGPMHGLQVKFGGAFAGYLIVFLGLIAIKPADVLHFHVWTVTGSLQFAHPKGEPDPNVNDVLIRFAPPFLSVMNKGRFAWGLPVTEDATGNPQFPDVQLDLRGYYGTTLPLGQGRYGAEDVALVIDKKARTIHIAQPVIMEQLGSGAVARATRIDAVPLPSTAPEPPVATVPSLPANVLVPSAGRIQ